MVYIGERIEALHVCITVIAYCTRTSIVAEKDVNIQGIKFYF